MRTAIGLLILLAALALTACGEPDPEAAGSDPPIQNAPVDQDPTPQTGTGGESQAKPDAPAEPKPN